MLFYSILFYSVFFVIWESETVFSVINDWVQYNHTPDRGFFVRKKY